LRQEQLFFALLRECLELGSITTEFLQDAIHKNYLRKDAFAVMAKCAPTRGGSFPDLRQEQPFFALLRECLELGSIATKLLQDAIRKN
jgi:hypothetical protein